MMSSMGFHLLLFLALLSLMSLGSDAALPAEVYWHSKLPNTPIPKHLSTLLQPDMAQKPAYWDMGINENIMLGKQNKPYDPNNQIIVWKWGDKPYDADNQLLVSKKPYDPNNQIIVWKWGDKPYDADNQLLVSKRPYDPNNQIIVWKWGDADKHEGNFDTHKIPTIPKFLLENDLEVGKKMRLHFPASTNKARILSRQVADSIPFSTDKLAEIYKYFSVKPESIQGELIKETVTLCEFPGLETEDKFCATSLESMVDKSVKHVGNKAQIYFNQIESGEIEQDYSIEKVKLIGENQVSWQCHKIRYPYAVYYCHAIKGTKIYEVGLVSSDGKQGSAVVVCHTNTTGFHPNHLAFLVLKIKPGEGTLCHTVTSDTSVWLPSTDSKLYNSA